LVFSQSRKMLDIIEKVLNKKVCLNERFYCFSRNLAEVLSQDTPVLMSCCKAFGFVPTLIFLESVLIDLKRTIID
jgi:hypothetical protein